MAGRLSEIGARPICSGGCQKRKLKPREILEEERAEQKQEMQNWTQAQRMRKKAA